MTDRAGTRAPSRERRSREEDAQQQGRNGHRDEDEARQRPRPRRAQSDGMGAARLAAEHVLQLTGRCPENVVSVARDDDGWQVGVEVMELHRIPETTDIMAIYDVILDGNGDLVRCERGQRYHRGRVEEDL